MSLTNLIKKIDKVNEQHQFINSKYRSNNRSTTYTNDKYQEEVQEKRIYGFSGQDMLKTFHSKQSNILQIKRPKTAFVRTSGCLTISSDAITKKKQIPRVFSAQRSNNKNRTKFIIQNDTNWIQHSQNTCHIKFNNKSLSKKSTALTIAKKKAKQYFIQLFEQNLKRQSQKKIPKTKPQINTVIYQRQQVKKSNKQNILFSDSLFFALTKTIEKAKTKKIICQLTQSLKNIKQYILISRKTSLFEVLYIKKKINMPLYRLQEDLFFIFPQRFSVLMMNVNKFTSLKLNVSKKEKQFINEANGQALDIVQILQNVIASNNILYLCFYHDRQIIYEQFVFGKMVSSIQKIQINLSIQQFYIKSFLALDSNSTFKSINATSKMLINGQIMIPLQYKEYICLFKQKSINYSDKSKKIISVNLYDVLLNGTKIVEKFKQQIKIQEKPTILKDTKSKRIVRKNNNWMYFYICFAYQKISIFVKSSHFFYLILPNFLQPYSILLDFFFSQLSQQSPRNLLLFFIFFVVYLFFIAFLIYIDFIFILHLLTYPFPLHHSQLNLIQIYGLLLFCKKGKLHPQIIIIITYHRLFFIFLCDSNFSLCLFLSHFFILFQLFQDNLLFSFYCCQNVFLNFIDSLELFRNIFFYHFNIQQILSFRQTNKMKSQKNQSVKVALRVRPRNKRQTQMNSPLCVSTQQNVLQIKKQNDIKQFVFDYVFGIDTKQEQVYEACGFSLVQNALEGFNGTIFAYGQTGAGKTFTMVGDYKDPEWKGIIPRGFDHVITAIQTSQNKKYVVRASFIEIYNEDIFDLLDGKGDVKKQLKQSPQTGVFIKQLKTVPVKSVDEMFKLLDYGNGNRSVAKTNMNATSSRSHALFTVHIQSLQNGDKVKASKLNFVDLAGSQRQGKTGAQGATLKEGAKINLSLTALGNVINSLVDGKKGGHIPYRDSKLTRLLQDSLGGNTKTLMIASVSPALDNFEQTLSTLRYAARARNIKNTPKVNQDPKDALIKQYLGQIQKLKKQLALGGVSSQVVESSQQLQRELQRAHQTEKKLSQKEAQLLEMKLKMKQMEQLIINKPKQTSQIAEKAKKRKMQKKKIERNQQINQMRVQQLQQQQQKDLQQKQGSEKQIDINFWKNTAKRLKAKLKSVIQDKKDLCAQFQDERQRLNNCIRNIEGDLSFFKQIAQKFLSTSDLQSLKDQSKFDYEKRQVSIPAFLLHDQKLTLPKTLKRHQVDQLWKQKRKGYKMQLLGDLPSLQSNSSTNFSQGSPEKKNIESPTKEQARNIFNQRRILRYINPQDERYKQKQYTLQNTSRQTFFRRTNFLIRDTSNSQNKRPVSNRGGSKQKLQPISRQKDKIQSQQKRLLSRGKDKLQPIIKK